MNDRLELSIAAEVSGAADVDKLNASLEHVGASADRTGKAAGEAFGKLRGFTADIGRASETLVALAAAHANTATAIERYALNSLPSAISSTDGLVNSYRALRLALSPTPFTAATIAVGVLTEETIRLVNIRAKLIEQQSLIAAVSRIPQSSVERIDAVTGIAGGDSAAVRSLYQTLSSRIDRNQFAVRSGLDTLGISSSQGRQNEAIDPTLLHQIAAGLSSIEDPAKRAAAAVALFGNEQAATALRELNGSFANASTAAENFGLTLDETSRTQIYRARQEFVQLKTALTDFSEVKGWWESFKTGTVIVAAAAEDMTRRGLHSLDELISKYVPGMQALRGALRGPSSASPPPAGDARKDSITQGLIADDLFAQAQGTAFRRSQTLEGQKAAQQEATTRANSAYSTLLQDAEKRRINPNDPTRLSDDQRFSLATQQQSAAALAVSIGLTVEKMEAAKRAADEADEAAKDVLKHQSEGLRSSRDLLSRSAYDPAAGRNYLGEREKATTLVDKNGDLQHYEMLDETRRNLDAAFSAYTRSLNQKASAEQIKNEEETFKRRIDFEGQVFQKRIQFDGETAQIELSTIDKTFAQQKTTAGFTRDERLKEVTLTGAGLNGDSATRNAFSQIAQKQAIENQFALDSALNDKDTLDREKRRQLSGVAVDRFTGKITDDEFFARNKAIEGSFGQQGGAIDDRYAHELLTTQQDAVQQTTEIIKRLENEQLDKFKSFAGSLFDASLSGGRGLPKFLEGQLQSIGRTVFTNAASDFVYPELKKLIPHADNPDSTLGKLLSGTPFAADPLRTAGLTLNTAGIKLDAAADKLLTLTGGGAGAPGSGGTGGGQIGSIFGGSTSNPFVFNNQTGDGNDILGTAPVGPMAPDLIMTGKPLPSAAGFGFNARTVAGITATGMGAFSAVQDFGRGGVRNDISGVGSALGGAAAIASLIPGGQLVGLGLGIASAVTSLIPALMTDPKVARQNQINLELAQNQYQAPLALNATQDSSGHFADFDAKGNLRTSNFSPIPNVTNPSIWEQTHGWFGGPPTFYDVPGRVNSPYGPAQAAPPPVVINHNYAAGAISTMDSSSFRDYVNQNHAAVGAAAAKNLRDHGAGGDFGSAVQSTIRG